MRHTYTIKWKGAEIECPSQAAAVKLLRDLTSADNSPESISWTAEEFEEFTGRIRVMQRRLLAFLLDNDKMSRGLKVPVWYATDAGIRRELHIADNRVLAGILSGISKIAIALDIDPKRVYQQKTTYKSGLPERTYWATSAFRKAAEDHDWPSSSDLEYRGDETSREG